MSNAAKVALTGIKPTGTPHLGNLLGMIRPALALASSHDAYYFIADGHALTTIHDAKQMRQLSYEVAATWLALGLDPAQVTLYRQSDLPETFELNWILSCVTPKGLLNRAHAYKSVVDANTAAGRSPDDGVSMGLYNYPVLMTADILIVDATAVPVGPDQKQHVEIARDIAESFNRTFGECLVLPEPVIEVIDVTGLDGQKMSKSYDNVIPIFADAKTQRKLVKRIVTDSRKPEEPKDPDTDNLFQIYGSFASDADTEAMRGRYLAGGVGYGEVKEALADLLDTELEGPRARYTELLADTAQIDAILTDGAARVRPVATATLARVKDATGL